MKQTIIPSPLQGTIPAIPSKSHAHRLLICAALANGSTEIECHSVSKDIEATAACLRGMGAEITWDGKTFRTVPGQWKSPCRLPCGESGSTLRFLLPVVAALGLDAEFHMEGRLPQRPLAPLDAQLEAHGVKLSHPKPDILRVEGKLLPGDYTLPGNVSSQYISGLLFALPLLDGESTLTVTGTVESASYIAMTKAALDQYQVTIPEKEHVYRISHKPYISPGVAQVEGDWSNAAFWLCAGAIGSPITVTGLAADSLQGDKTICGLLEQFGAAVTIDKDRYTVTPGKLRAIDIDAAAIPDLVPVLAVVAAAAEGDTRIYNASRLRLKESDRLATVHTFLQTLGASVEESDDGLLIHGGRPLTGGTTESYNDHRIAMSAAIASIRAAAPVTVEQADAVNKSYPKFWEDFQSLQAIQEGI